MVDVVALNACDTVYKRDTIQYCDLCVGGCNPNRLGEVPIINNFDMQWQATSNTINVESDIAEQGNFQLIDTKGTVLYNWVASIEKGNTQVNMPKDIKQLSKGIYLIHYQSETQTKTISIFNAK
ncbi:MAG: T9SS type A sorting domain-containing protein [Bacteroidetes bacterium]|nr:T9SS type A sorting domain-containing protein [Bacteroidota bacterium]